MTLYILVAKALMFLWCIGTGLSLLSNSPNDGDSSICAILKALFMNTIYFIIEFSTIEQSWLIFIPKKLLFSWNQWAKLQSLLNVLLQSLLWNDFFISSIAKLLWNHLKSSDEDVSSTLMTDSLLITRINCSIIDIACNIFQKVEWVK